MEPTYSWSLLLLAPVLVSIFAATATTKLNHCFLGMGIPSMPLQGYHDYVTQETCGAASRRYADNVFPRAFTYFRLVLMRGVAILHGAGAILSREEWTHEPSPMP
ncbi:hypothetical protein VPH35_079941 [Triticum aestivum]